MSKRKTISIIFFLYCALSYGQTLDICDIKTINDVEKAKIIVSDFIVIDTIVKGISYNLIYHCPNGLSILGNTNKKGEKSGMWKFYNGNLFIIGEFKKNEMTGNWYNDPEIFTYVKGKKKKVRIIF